MSKKSLLSRNVKRMLLHERYKHKIEEFKRRGDYKNLQKIPRGAFSTRIRNRCVISGRSRGYIRYFGVSRIVFRELASFGLIPGVKKSS